MRSLTMVTVAVLALAAACRGQTSVTLRAKAELAVNAQEVRLADVADLSGDEALTLGAVVVGRVTADAGRGAMRVGLAEVRSALEAAGVNWGRVTLRGSTCEVGVGGGDRGKTISRAEERRPGDDRGRPRPIDMTGPATVRTLIAARIAVAHGVSADRVRLGFEAADGDVLSMPAADGAGRRRVNIDFGGSPRSARVPVTVTIYDGERIELNRTVQAEVHVRRAVVKAATTLDRGRVIGTGDVLSEDRWGPPGRSAGAGLGIDDVVGQVATRRINAGQEIDRDDVGAALACKRGDTVLVHCLSGSVVVKVRARAMSAARDGELVELKREGADRDEKPFIARMSGRGRAVLETGTER